MNQQLRHEANPNTLLALDSGLLRTLVAIADTGSFVAAARVVNRTPSAVSMQMKRLEGQLGQAMFAPQGRSVVLTPEGEALLTFARHILKLAEKAVVRFRGASRARNVRLRIPNDYTITFLPPILARFAVTHPHVKINVTCSSNRTLHKMLERDELDLAFVTANAAPPSKCNNTVYRDRLVLAELAHKSAHEQRPLPLAVGPATCPWREKAIQELDRSSVPYRVAFTSEHYSNQLVSVLTRLAIAPLPLAVLPPSIRDLTNQVSLPSLGHYELELRRAPLASGDLIDAIADHVTADFQAREMNTQ